jgi:hypothetical protein
MRRLTFSAAIAATIAFSACGKDRPTEPQTAVNQDDYALVMFGQSGAALEGTFGTLGAAYDGRSGSPAFPDSLKLTDAQKTAIAALRTNFKTAHQAELDQLRAIFERARTARQGGASRDSVRAILAEGRALAQSMRAAVEGLHQAVLAVLTDAQRAWLAAHRPAAPPGV